MANLLKIKEKKNQVDSMNILVVEDDPLFARYIEKLVGKLGHKVDVLNSGADAVKEIQKKRFDLVLLDIFLPDITAHQLIPKLKSIDAGVKIITMTGDNTEQLENEIRKLGIIYYMAKPIMAEELSNILVHFSKTNKREDSPK